MRADNQMPIADGWLTKAGVDAHWLESTGAEGDSETDDDDGAIMSSSVSLTVMPASTALAAALRQSLFARRMERRRASLLILCFNNAFHIGNLSAMSSCFLVVARLEKLFMSLPLLSATIDVLHWRLGIACGAQGAQCRIINRRPRHGVGLEPARNIT